MNSDRAIGILEHLAAGDTLAKEAIEAIEANFKRNAIHMATADIECNRVNARLQGLFRDGCLPEALIPPRPIDRILLSGHDDNDDCKALVRWINAQVKP
jgi:hypothetical protein